MKPRLWKPEQAPQRLPHSRLGEFWLLDELTHLRRLLDDIRESYSHGGGGEAEAPYFEALGVIRSIEVETYGTTRADEDVTPKAAE